MMPEVARFQAGQIKGEDFAKEAEAWENNFRLAYEMASKATPPPDLAEAHSMILAALRLYQHVARVYRFAGQAGDPVKRELMLEAQELLKAANDLYDQGEARLEAAQRRAGLGAPEEPPLPGG